MEIGISSWTHPQPAVSGDEQDRWPRPIATVDAVLMTLDGGRLSALVMKRGDQPFAGSWALPGGYIRPSEDVDAEVAVRRVLVEKTGFAPSWVEQLATFSGERRDPRGWSLSVAWIALAPRDWFGDLRGPAGPMRLVPVDDPGVLAFDHVDIVATAAARLRGKGAWSILPGFLLGRCFTLSELQSAYEAVLGGALDTSNFRRKVAELDLLEPAGLDKTRPGRPARLFCLREAAAPTFNRML